MTISDSFWSFTRLAESWTSSAPPPPAPPKPRRRTAIYTHQHMETIGGGHKSPQDALLGNPRLPVELIVHVVLLAAHDVSLSGESCSARRLLELARVGKACHRAIFALLLLPDVCLYGLEQVRAFAVSLDTDRLGVRAIARTRVRSLTLRARSLESLQHGYGPALFDASQAQTHFERDVLPFIRVVLAHCRALRMLHLDGVPRGLQRQLTPLSCELEQYSCLVGHYGADLERDFWHAQRWTSLTHLQLHGPRFRFTPGTAATLACLPSLAKLGLVVPMIVSSPAETSGASGASGAIDLDLTGSINPLQILIDRCATLQVLLLVGHTERDYVGYTEKYRRWLRGLRRPRLAAVAEVRVQLVSALRREGAREDEEAMSRRRVHPCEVSAWMMHRSRHGGQWFEGEQRHSDSGALDYWIESFELADHPSATSTNAATTATTSALMSRTGSNTPSSTTAAGIQQRQSRRAAVAVDEAIQAVDMLSDEV